MTPTEFLEWFNENGTYRETYYSNNITYELVIMRDGWVGILERDDYNGNYYPQIQARDLNHAKSWCTMTERINIPFQVIA